ncbi:MAG: helix-turn-helix domain-containing protein [Bacteroides sp.]
MEHTESQCKMIKEHLMEGKGITALDALFKFRCMNLKGRIHDLRKEGLPIDTEMIEVNGKRVARYSLCKEQLV